MIALSFIQPRLEPEVATGRDYASRLRYEAQDLAQDLRKQARLKKRGSELGIKQIDQVMDEIETITTDLDTLLAQASTSDHTMTKQLVVVGTAIMTTLLALVSAVAVSDCRRLHIDLAHTCSNVTPIGESPGAARFHDASVSGFLLYMVALGSFGFLTLS